MKKYSWSTHRVAYETKDAVTIFFDTGGAAISYKAGQFLNLSCEINGERLSRSYSFSSAPGDPYPAITVKRIPGGKMSNFLFEHAADTAMWDIEAPFGNFVLDANAAGDEEYVFLAGGSGISPLYSMIKSCSSAPLLLYSNKTPEDIIFQKAIAERCSRQQLHVYHAFSAQQDGSAAPNEIAGRFPPLAIQSIIRRHIKHPETAHFFICGPAGLMQMYREVLAGMNLPQERIHMEYYEPLISDKPVVCADGPPHEVLVSYFENQVAGDELQTYRCTRLIDVQPGQLILDALKDHGIQAPHSCLTGTCGSCTATKESGSVLMRNNFALTPEEVSQGRFLLCQSIPLDQSLSLYIE